MVVERLYVERLLAEIERHAALLETASQEPAEQLFADPLRALGVQHALQIAIEGIVNVTHHLVSKGNLGAPDSHIESLSMLGRHGIVGDLGLLDRLPRMIRFRNLLVHRYWEVREDLVYAILQGNLGDFALFCRSIEEFLERNPSF